MTRRDGSDETVDIGERRERARAAGFCASGAKRRVGPMRRRFLFARPRWKPWRARGEGRRAPAILACELRALRSTTTCGVHHVHEGVAVDLEEQERLARHAG